MKNAIDFLQSKGIEVCETGLIISELPDGLEGIKLVDDLEEFTMTDDYCFTIIGNNVVKQDL